MVMRKTYMRSVYLKRCIGSISREMNTMGRPDPDELLISALLDYFHDTIYRRIGRVTPYFVFNKTSRGEAEGCLIIDGKIMQVIVREKDNKYLEEIYKIALEDINASDEIDDATKRKYNDILSSRFFSAKP